MPEAPAMIPHALLSLAAAAMVFGPFRATADPSSSLAAYFDGDVLKESLLRLTPKNEASVRRLDRTLMDTRRFVRVEIVTVYDSGALVSVKAYSNEKLRPDSLTPLEHPFFLYGLPGGLAKGAIWEGRVYPAGQLRYTSPDKSEQAINALATSKEWAIRAMEEAATPVAAR